MGREEFDARGYTYMSARPPRLLSPNHGIAWDGRILHPTVDDEQLLEVLLGTLFPDEHAKSSRYLLRLQSLRTHLLGSIGTIG